MGTRYFSTYVTADTAIVTTAETVVATLSGVSTNQAGQSIDFHGSFTGTSGANTTGYTIRVREDSLTGTVVGEAVADVIEAAVGAVETHTVDIQSAAPGEFSGKSYVLTVEPVAATANAAITQASFSATVKP